MKKIDYQDERGRLYKVQLPDDAPDSDAALGIVIGPPDVVDFLEMPEPFATRLHNQLFNRGLLTAEDVQRRPQDVRGAILSAASADVAKVHAAYVSLEKEDET